MMRWLFFFLIVVSPLKANVPYLFVLYDAGETHALAPVIQALDEEEYQVLVFGTARQEAPKVGIPPQRIISVASDALEPDVVVSGTVSEVQLELCKTLRSQGSAIVVYYENPYFTLATHPFSKLTTQFQECADLILAASKKVADSITGPVKVVGQPAFDIWKKQVDAVDKDAVRMKLNLQPEKPVLLFCGGYWGDYEEAVRFFAPTLVGLSGYHVVVSPHPKTDGLFEKSVFPRAICEKGLVSTMEAAAIADIVVCHQSMVAAQALFAGKHVIHIALPESTFSTFAIEAGLIPKVTSPEKLQRAIEDALGQPSLPLHELYNRAGMPENAVELILEAIRIEL